MALSKSEKTAVLTLLEMASTDGSQADKRAQRATVLGALGMTEDDATAHLADARDQAEQAQAEKPAEQPADDDTAQADG
jgi:hypothetical protein